MGNAERAGGLTIGLALIAVACGDETGSSTQSTQKDIDPCELLTEEYVEQVTGKPFDNLDTFIDASGQPVPLDDMTCHYRSEGPPPPDSVCQTCKSALDIMLNISTSARWTAELVKMEIEVSDSTPDELPGVGDAAFIGETFLGILAFDYVGVLVGTVRLSLAYTVSLQGPEATEERSRNQAILMAKEAASKL
jgi:hypothetical protein